MPAWTRALLGTLLVLAFAQVGGLTERLNRAITDAHWRAAAESKPTPFPPEILVVAIDDRTLQEAGRLRYWSRQRYAQLLDRLKHASAVGFDILFTEPDVADRAGDTAFAAAIRRHGRVVLPLHQWQEARAVNAESQAQADALLQRLPPVAHEPEATHFVNAATLQPPIPALMNAAAALGAADVNADSDGVYRTPLMLRPAGDGKGLPHFALALARVARGLPNSEPLGSAPGGLNLGGRAVPLEEGTLRLQPIARRGGTLRKGVGAPVPTLSFQEALQADPEQFRDKIVLVGETATGTSDVRANVLDEGLRGVELNAEIVANLLALSPVTTFPGALQWLLLFVAVGVPLRLYALFTPRWAAIGSAVALAIPILLMEVGFWVGRMVPSWTPVLLGSLSATGLMLAQRAIQEEAQKRHLRQNFSMYVAPELVEQIVRQPDLAQREGVRQRIAVLFSDVRSFTSYSEQNPPELVVKQMSEYLTEMTESVDEHQGMLDKYIGDAVMALFGPFIEEENVNLSARSVACALDMLDRLDRLNADWQRREMPLFRIGIGIHIGDAVVGDIGSHRRRQYTALGDTVNLSARLQSETKELKATLVVSEAVKREAEPVLGKLVEFRDRGVITVRGRVEPVRVFEARRIDAAGEREMDATQAAAQA